MNVTPKVYFSKTENRVKFVEKIMSKFAKDIRGEKKIFVKPNIVSYEPYPTTTHPDVLRAVLSKLPQNSEIIVADAPVPNSPVTIGFGKKDIIKNHVLAKVCKECGYELHNLYDFDFKKISTGSGFSLNVSRVALDADYMISLPVMKTHCVREIGMTGALKNNFGLLSARERITLHSSNTLPFRVFKRLLGEKEKTFSISKKIFWGKKEINIAIAELNKIRKPDLFIVDMVDTLINANELRHGGVKVHVGYMFAGEDPVALDCFGLELLKKFDNVLKDKNWYDIPSIAYASKIGVGNPHFKKVEIKCD